MVIVPRIAAVSYLDTIPFLYGIQHEGNFRAELLLSSPQAAIRNFTEGKADIALVPATAVPLLKGAHPVTGYCIAATGASRAAVLAGCGPHAEARRVWLDPTQQTEALLTEYLMRKHWKITPEYLDAGSVCAPEKAGKTTAGTANSGVADSSEAAYDGAAGSGKTVCGGVTPEKPLPEATISPAADLLNRAPAGATDSGLLPENPELPSCNPKFSPGDFRLLTGEQALLEADRYPTVCDLSAEWRRATRLPFVFWVWVARDGIDADWIEGLHTALTYGIEHTYEAIVEAGYADKPYDAYGYLTAFDYIFDNQKQKSLQKIWNAGLKVTPRANPG